MKTNITKKMNLRSKHKRTESRKKRAHWKPKDFTSSDSESDEADNKLENPIPKNSRPPTILLFCILLLFVSAASSVYVCCDDYKRHPDCSVVNPKCTQFMKDLHFTINSLFTKIINPISNNTKEL